MALLDLVNQVLRLGFAQNYTTHSKSELISLSGTAPVTVSSILQIPQQLAISTISFTLGTTSVNINRTIKADLLQGAKVIATYQFLSADTPPLLQIVDQNFTYVGLLNSSDVFSWVITNLDAPLEPGQGITFRATISVQGTPV